MSITKMQSPDKMINKKTSAPLPEGSESGIHSRLKKKTPLRRCVGCREMKDKRLLVRVVLNADNHLFLDETGKAHGRGAYLCKDDANCLQQARKAKSLEKSLKCRVSIDIYDLMQANINESLTIE